MGASGAAFVADCLDDQYCCSANENSAISGACCKQQFSDRYLFPATTGTTVTVIGASGYGSGGSPTTGPGAGGRGSGGGQSLSGSGPSGTSTASSSSSSSTTPILAIGLGVGLGGALVLVLLAGAVCLCFQTQVTLQKAAASIPRCAGGSLREEAVRAWHALSIFESRRAARLSIWPARSRGISYDSRGTGDGVEGDGSERTTTCDLESSPAKVGGRKAVGYRTRTDSALKSKRY